MARRADLGQLVDYDGCLMEVVGIADGRSIILRPVREPACPRCGSTGEVHILEDSLLFQRVKPVKTIAVEPPERGTT